MKKPREKISRPKSKKKIPCKSGYAIEWTSGRFSFHNTMQEAVDECLYREAPIWRILQCVMTRTPK